MGSYQNEGFLTACRGLPGNLIYFPLGLTLFQTESVWTEEGAKPLSIPPSPEGTQILLAAHALFLTRGGSQLATLLNAMGIKILLCSYFAVANPSLFPSKWKPSAFPLHSHSYLFLNPLSLVFSLSSLPRNRPCCFLSRSPPHPGPSSLLGAFMMFSKLKSFCHALCYPKSDLTFPSTRYN